MEALFAKVVQTTKSARETVTSGQSGIELTIADETEPEMLERHIQELFDIICYGFEENVSLAAERGANRAIICIYKSDAMYRRVIPIGDLLVPNEHILTKLSEYEIPSLLIRLRERFNPFMVRVARLDNVIDIKDRENMYCVVIEWDIETPEIVCDQERSDSCVV